MESEQVIQSAAILIRRTRLFYFKLHLTKLDIHSLTLFLPNLSYMGFLSPISLRFNSLFFRSYQELAYPTFDFLPAYVIKLPSNAKINFLQWGTTHLSKSIFLLDLIIMGL